MFVKSLYVVEIRFVCDGVCLLCLLCCVIIGFGWGVKGFFLKVKVSLIGGDGKLVGWKWEVGGGRWKKI